MKTDDVLNAELDQRNVNNDVSYVVISLEKSEAHVHWVKVVVNLIKRDPFHMIVHEIQVIVHVI